MSSGTGGRFTLIRPRRGETDAAARTRVMSEHPEIPEENFKFAREIFDQQGRGQTSSGNSTRGRRGGGTSSSRARSEATSATSAPPPPPASPWFLGPVVYGAPPERGEETFRVTGASLEMALSEAFPTPALAQRKPWLAAATTDYSVDEVSDETFRCLQSQGKRVEDVLGPYQFRLYNALLLKAVKAANSRCAGDESAFNVSELQSFLDEVGVCHVTAPMAEYLARHFPRKDSGQRYYCGLEAYTAEHTTPAEWAVDLSELIKLAQAEQRGQSSLNTAVTAATQAGNVFNRTGVRRVSAGARTNNADPVQFALDATTVVGGRLGWSRSLKKKVEDFFYRVKATSRGDGPRLVEVNFSRWAREDMVSVRCPITMSVSPDGVDVAEVISRHSASREEVAVDWAFRVRWQQNASTFRDSYPEFAGGRECPFFTVASGRAEIMRTLVRQLV